VPHAQEHRVADFQREGQGLRDWGASEAPVRCGYRKWA